MFLLLVLEKFLLCRFICMKSFLLICYLFLMYLVFWLEVVFVMLLNICLCM